VEGTERVDKIILIPYKAFKFARLRRKVNCHLVGVRREFGGSVTPNNRRVLW